jgi:predicted nicotinamide N-methyase
MEIALDQSPDDFVRENTRLNKVPLIPEVPLCLADEGVSLWQVTEDDLSSSGLPPPFWAFAWAGGQALARHVLDNPDLVRGRNVLDFAAGSGIVGIAALKAGAACVLCADIDPYATAACLMNAEANGMKVKTTKENLIGTTDQTWEVILAGDICYEQPLADEVLAWLSHHAARGTLILLGDPGRTYLPKNELIEVATYRVETNRELEDTDVRRTSVWQLNA